MFDNMNSFIQRSDPMKYLRKEMRVFFRSIYLPLIFIIATMSFWSECVRDIVQEGNKIFPYTSLMLILLNQGGGLLVFAMMLFIGYELSQKQKNSFSNELIDAYPGVKIKVLLAKVEIVALLSFMLFATILPFHFYILLHANVTFDLIFINVTIATLMSYFLIPLMSGLLGMAIGEIAERYSGFVIIALLLFFISPLSEILFSGLVEIGLGLGDLKRIFSFFTPKANDSKV